MCKKILLQIYLLVSRVWRINSYADVTTAHCMTIFERWSCKWRMRTQQPPSKEGGLGLGTKVPPNTC